MILTIDAGNSNILIGCIQDKNVLFTERISTSLQKTDLEYAIDFKIILELYHIFPSEIKGSIISSVVPPINYALSHAVYKVTSKEPLLVGPGVKNGLKILTDNPAQLGSDLVVDAVAALSEYSAPMIIIDMGTATTFSVIDEKKQYIGGAIVPGLQISLDSMSNRTSQLPHIGLDAPKRAIGRNTIECMKSGSILGCASMIDGMIQRLRAELEATSHAPVTVIATGGLARFVICHCQEEILLDKDLILKGLSIIYEKNKKN